MHGKVIREHVLISMGFACSSVSKESACSAGDRGSILGLGRCPGEGNGAPLQYPCLGNLMDRGAWWAAVMGSQSMGFPPQCLFSYFSKLQHLQRFSCHLSRGYRLLILTGLISEVTSNRERPHISSAL